MKLKIKITPFLISSVILLIYAIQNHLFDFWTLRGGESLIGVIAIAAVGVSLILLLVDRQLLRKFKLKKVYIIELISILLILVIYQYNKRHLICEINENVDYFVIIYEVDEQPDFSYSFPFSKSIRIENNGIYLTREKDMFDNFPEITGREHITTSESSHDIKNLDRIYKAEFIRINNADIKFDSLELKIDSLIRLTLK